VKNLPLMGIVKCLRDLSCDCNSSIFRESPVLVDPGSEISHFDQFGRQSWWVGGSMWKGSGSSLLGRSE
jgi:hypothetical protein